MAGTPKKSLKEIIRDEYIRCANDPVHFMRKYCIIQHPMKGKIYFHLYPFQERTLHSLRDNRFNVILSENEIEFKFEIADISVFDFDSLFFFIDGDIILDSLFTDNSLFTNDEFSNEILRNFLLSSFVFN